MRTLERNKQDIYYALFVDTTDTTDEYGDYNGEPTASYTEPVLLRANVSASRGTADSELFGIDLDYSRTICIEGTDCPIKEDSILWIGRVPDDKGTVKHNFIVKAVAISLNNTVYAVKEVNVS